MIPADIPPCPARHRCRPVALLEDRALKLCAVPMETMPRISVSPRVPPGR
jgi:hypothetical protein